MTTTQGTIDRVSGPGAPRWVKTLLCTAGMVMAAAGMATTAVAAPVFGGTVPAKTGGATVPIGAGNQNWPGMLGLNFSIVGGVFQLTHLGVFDDRMNGLTSNLTVSLYEVVGASRNLVASTVFNSGTANPGGEQFIYKALTGTPIFLDAGKYTIRAIGFNGNDRNFNTNEVGGANNFGNANNDNTTTPITFNTFGGFLQNGSSVFEHFSSTASLSSQLAASGREFLRSSTFGAGTLQLTQVVPEPASMALGLMAMGALVAARRRRQSE